MLLYNSTTRVSRPHINLHNGWVDPCDARPVRQPHTDLRHVIDLWPERDQCAQLITEARPAPSIDPTPRGV